MDVVISEGLDALTMPRLAAEADAAVGGLYRYFESKDALVGGLQAMAVEFFGHFLRARCSGSPLERVRSAAASWPAFAEAHPELFALVDRSLSDPAAVLSEAEARRVDAAVREALEPLVEALTAAVEQGSLSPGDAEVRAHALWAAVHGVGHFHKRDRIQPERLHAEALRRELVEGLLAGWGAPPASGASAG